MLGLLLISLSSLATEIGSSIGKRRMAIRQQTLYTTGFVTFFGAAILMVSFALFVPRDFFLAGFPGGFVFSLASLPTLLPRIALELVQAHFTIRAVLVADRSTFGFLRTLTIPFLLVVDISLGYGVNAWQIVGVILVTASVALLYIRHDLRTAGSWLVLFTAVNAVATISLYKYDITHFNSVAAEQGIVLTIITAYFFLGALFKEKTNPLKLIVRPYYFAQFMLTGVATILGSFAFLFLPASVVIAGKRCVSILWTIFTGKMYFRETHILMKLTSFSFITGGIFLLTI